MILSEFFLGYYIQICNKRTPSLVYLFVMVDLPFPYTMNIATT